MMQLAINNQENGSLLHGKFIMTMHWCIWSNVYSNFWPNTTFYMGINPCILWTWHHVAFSSPPNLDHLENKMT